MTEGKDVVELVQQVNRQYGIIDILVNNIRNNHPRIISGYASQKMESGNVGKSGRHCLLYHGHTTANG